MKKGGGSASTIIIAPSKSVLVYALHSLEYVLGLARFRVFVPNMYVCIFKIKKPGSISLIWSRDIEKSLKISFGFNFVSFRTIGSKISIPGMHLSNRIQLSFPVVKFQCTQILRTDGQTFFEKVLFFLPDQEYIYMSIPIVIISPIYHLWHIFD